MKVPERTTARNTLTAIVLYELARLETLPLATQSLIASKLTAAIQTLRMSQAHADEAFHESQASYFASLKRSALDNRNQTANQVSFSLASIMHCVHKAFEIEGLQKELITSVLNWVKDNSLKIQS
jgi:hypothetical protein